MSDRVPWLAIRRPMPYRRALVLKVIAFCIPLLVWCAVSYVPWIWHPQMKLTDRGGTTMYRVGDQVDKADFAREQQRLADASKPLMQAVPANPIFLPPPHEVGRAFYTAFTTEPARKGTPWLHERVWHSVQLLFWAFLLACGAALPIGVLCGTFDLFAKLIEPFIDFMRYMPAPAFGALMMAIFGLSDQPKIAIISIGLFFNMLLVAANTVRTLDVSLLEAAQTLGAKRTRLLTAVVVPGVLPMLYTDLRIALGFGWVYLVIAELIGEMSGITEFINQQGKFRNYPNVFVGIITLGILGFITDQFLSWLGQVLFPWHSRRPIGWFRRLIEQARASRVRVGRAESGAGVVTTGGVADVSRA